MTKTKRTREFDVTSGPIVRKMLAFALPLMLTGVVQHSFSAIDKLIVGRYVGGDALGGVAVTSSIITLIVCLFNGLASGSSVCISHSIGMRDEKGTRELTHTALSIAVFGGIFMGLFGIIFSRPLLDLIGTPDDIMGYALVYIRIYFAGAPFLLLLNYGNAILRATGDTKHPMLFVMIGGGTKILLGFVFVAIFGMDADGVALSTGISNLLACTLCVGTLMRLDGWCKLTLNKLKINFGKLKGIFALGIPAGIQSAVYGLSATVMQSSINLFDSSAISGNGASASIESYAETISDSIGSAAMTFSAQNMGARKYKRVKSVFIKACVLAALITVAFSAVTIPLRELLIGCFIPDDPVAVAYGAQRYLWIISLQFLSSLMSVALIALRGMGRSFSGMLVALIGTCATRILWVMTVFQAIPELETLYAVYPVSWVLTFGSCLCIFIYTYRKLIREERAEAKEAL